MTFPSAHEPEPIAAYNASTIARWFLAWADSEEEGALSNLKLQKLLYYAQGHHLARFGAPLFADEIQAWAHGPVVPAVYRQYKDHGSNAIPFTEDFDFFQVDTETTDLLASVWETFGSKSAWKLREMTHSEAPWTSSYRDGEHFITIPRSVIYRYFRGLSALAE
jgi:uncharacterized phage-associated protein